MLFKLFFLCFFATPINIHFLIQFLLCATYCSTEKEHNYVRTRLWNDTRDYQLQMYIKGNNVGKIVNKTITYLLHGAESFLRS